MYHVCGNIMKDSTCLPQKRALTIEVFCDDAVAGSFRMSLPVVVCILKIKILSQVKCQIYN